MWNLPLGFVCGLALGMFCGTLGGWAFADEEKRALILAGALIATAAGFALRAGSWAFVDVEDWGAWVTASLIGVAVGIGLRVAIGAV
jgi:hypothetical protein